MRADYFLILIKCLSGFIRFERYFEKSFYGIHLD